MKKTIIIPLLIIILLGLGMFLTKNNLTLTRILEESSGGSFPATGQTTSCRANDDGDLQTGAVLSYTDNGDGTVTDNNTGLMWASDGDGAGCNNGADANWNDAIDYCANLTFADYDDWYLPNVKELISLVKYDANISDPHIDQTYIDQTYFSNTHSAIYWSSTIRPVSTANALGVNFGYGSVYYNYKAKSNIYVRCVRGQ